MARSPGLAELADQRALSFVAGSFLHERFMGVLAMLLLTATILGTIILLASWGAKTRREKFIRCHAGILLAWWYVQSNARRFQVGGPKVFWLQLAPLLSPSRNGADVLVHVVSLVLLVIILLRLTSRSWSVHALAGCLLYMAVFDPLFIGDYFITPVVLSFFWFCLPTAQGSVAGLQLQWMFLMSGSGLSKVGPHFDRPTAAHLALMASSLLPPWVNEYFWRGPEDLRPTSFAAVLGASTILAEIVIPMFLFSSSRTVVRLAVFGLALMHTAMSICTVILTYMEVFMTMVWCYLFLGGDRDGPLFGFDYSGFRAMPRAVKVLMFAFYVLNMSGQLQPVGDWHPWCKYAHFASGNQPIQNPVLFKKSAYDKLQKARLADPIAFTPGIQHGADQLVVRWFLELNYKPSAALVDCAIALAGGNATDYAMTFSESSTSVVGGGECGSMTDYNLHLFRALAGLGLFEAGEIMQVWMHPVAWPQLHMGRQAMTWSIWDGKNGLVRSGELTSAQLRSIRMPSHVMEFLPPECSSGA
mmetsp:Transcript_2188/g.4870  ORF Transcript_2188/g.4870 Transcript_2188/m.4870 type:complete len:529 (+) Transcript_2188:44-1630(+)